MKRTAEAQASGDGAELRAVMESFADWRREKKSGERIPQRLWEAATGLHPRHSIYQIARALRLDFSDVRKRVGGSAQKAEPSAGGTTSFLELPMGVGGGVADCRMKVSGKGKVRVTIRLRAASGSVVVEVLRQLWSQRA